ncbi:Uma2 family endonuclease [Luteolibacter sp. Populi]|uniref:Uma2 family endonuclease n=1 Tax=Luteolibacter sp. Populi TaxID=3230487 RepID=UPI0034655109
MAAVIEGKKTVADFMALGEGPPYAELIDGEIIMAPSPFRSHQWVAQRLYFLIQLHLEASPAGELYMAPFDVHLGEHDVLCPDLSFFAKESLHLLSDRGAEGAPDLAIEVLSPSTARRDRKVKREIYARHGVKELWLVHPDAETIEVFDFSKQQNEPVAVLENGTHPAITTAILPGLELALAKVFRS